jgi:hypothetical protein
VVNLALFHNENAILYTCRLGLVYKRYAGLNMWIGCGRRGMHTNILENAHLEDQEAEGTIRLR